MERLYVLLLWSFFLPYLVGLSSGASIVASGLTSPDKLLKPFLMYALLFLLLINRGWHTHKKVIHYFLPSFIFLLILSIHLFVLNNSLGDIEAAKKEIFRMVVFVIIILASSMVRMQVKDYKFLIGVMTVFGVPLGILAVLQSATGQVDMSWKYVGGYLRAGTGLVDANSLGALMNIIALLSLAGYMIAKHKLYRLGFLSVFVLLLGARFFTFSSGSFISIVVSLFTIFILLRKVDARLFKQFFSVAILGSVILIIVIIYYGLYEALFYRLNLSDESVVEASVTSRWSQYVDLFSIIVNRAYVLIAGVGSIGATLEISNGLNFHNSYLRPLITAGLVGFFCYMYIFLKSLKNYWKAVCVPDNTREERIIYIVLYSSFIGWSVQAATIPNDTSVIQWYFFILAYTLEGLNRRNRIITKLAEVSQHDNNQETKYKKCELVRRV